MTTEEKLNINKTDIYDFGDIYEYGLELYYKNNELIIPDSYKHPKNGITKIYTFEGICT